MENKANVNAESEEYGKALSVASYSGEVEVDHFCWKKGLKLMPEAENLELRCQQHRVKVMKR